MKKAILITMLTLCTSVSFAQSSNSNSSSSGTGNSTLDNAMNQAKNQAGDFNSRVPNPFVFCAAPKPSRGNPLRPVWDQICPSGNAQAAAAPVPVPTGSPIADTSALKEQFNKTNGK